MKGLNSIASINNIWRSGVIIATLVILFQNCQPLHSNSAGIFRQNSAGGGGDGGGDGNGSLDPHEPTSPVRDPVTNAPVNGFDPDLDPGLGRGSWRPPGTSKFLVADTALRPNYPGVTQIPGCLNGGINSGACYLAHDFNGFSMSAGSVLSVRYQLPDIPASQNTAAHMIELSSGIGGGVPAPLTFSLSVRPGDFSHEECLVRAQFNSSPSIAILYPGYQPATSGASCPLEFGAWLYVNIRVETVCDRCTFKLNAQGIMR